MQQPGPVVGRVDRVEGTGKVVVSLRRHDVTHKYTISLEKLEALLLAYSEGHNVDFLAEPGKFHVRPIASAR